MDGGILVTGTKKTAEVGSQIGPMHLHNRAAGAWTECGSAADNGSGDELEMEAIGAKVNAVRARLSFENRIRASDEPRRHEACVGPGFEA